MGRLLACELGSRTGQDCSVLTRGDCEKVQCKLSLSLSWKISSHPAGLREILGTACWQRYQEPCRLLSLPPSGLFCPATIPSLTEIHGETELGLPFVCSHASLYLVLLRLQCLSIIISKDKLWLLRWNFNHTYSMCRASLYDLHGLSCLKSCGNAKRTNQTTAEQWCNTTLVYSPLLGAQSLQWGFHQWGLGDQPLWLTVMSLMIIWLDDGRYGEERRLPCASAEIMYFWNEVCSWHVKWHRTFLQLSWQPSALAHCILKSYQGHPVK